jgi:hypothetical protein
MMRDLAFVIHNAKCECVSHDATTQRVHDDSDFPRVRPLHLVN